MIGLCIIVSETVKALKTTGISWDLGTFWTVESERKPMPGIQTLMLIPGARGDLTFPAVYYEKHYKTICHFTQIARRI